MALCYIITYAWCDLILFWTSLSLCACVVVYVCMSCECCACEHVACVCVCVCVYESVCVCDLYSQMCLCIQYMQRKGMSTCSNYTPSSCWRLGGKGGGIEPIMLWTLQCSPHIWGHAGASYSNSIRYTTFNTSMCIRHIYWYLSCLWQWCCYLWKFSGPHSDPPSYSLTGNVTFRCQYDGVWWLVWRECWTWCGMWMTLSILTLIQWLNLPGQCLTELTPTKIWCNINTMKYMCRGLTTFLIQKMPEWRRYIYSYSCSRGVLEKEGLGLQYPPRLPSLSQFVWPGLFWPASPPYACISYFLLHCLYNDITDFNLMPLLIKLFTQLGWWRPSFMFGTYIVLKSFNSSMWTLANFFHIHYTTK